MQKIFKNAEILDLVHGKTELVDILVENCKIKEFGRFEDFDGEVIDLEGNFVLPNFVNVFCHSFKAFENDYGTLDDKDDGFLANVSELMLAKNVLAGAICNDVATNNQISQNFQLECVDKLSESQLSNLSEYVGRTKPRLFMKVGQSLDELGTVDREYKKPLSQVLEDFGFLDRKPIIVGGNCFEKDDLTLFSQYDCNFCLTVGEDGKNGRRPTNLISLLNHDFCVGIGSGYSFEIDFFAFMRQILLTQRGMFEDKNILSEQEVLKIATKNGAHILGLSSDLKTNADANFMVVKKTFSLYDDIFKTIVWEKSKKDVVMTVFNGEIVQKNGEILMKNLPTYDKILEKIVEKI